MVRIPRRRKTNERQEAARHWQAQERDAARGRILGLAASTPDPVRGSAMAVPQRGDTVRVMRDGVLYLELVVARTEPGTHEGWHTIRGGVKREDSRGPYFESRSVYAELQHDGSVRMLSTDERIGTSPVPGQRCYGSAGPEDGDCDYRMPHGEHPVAEAPGSVDAGQ